MEKYLPPLLSLGGCLLLQAPQNLKMEHWQADQQRVLLGTLGWSLNDLRLVITCLCSRPSIPNLFDCEVPSLPLPAPIFQSLWSQVAAGLVGS